MGEFAWQMGLYTKAETQSPYFFLFLQGCVWDFTMDCLMCNFGDLFSITSIVHVMFVKYRFGHPSVGSYTTGSPSL